MPRTPVLSALVISLTVALIGRPDAALAATWYWDTNGTTAGAGSTPSGIWGGNNYWNSDATGGAGGTFATSISSTDTAVFVAGPGATSGTGAYEITLAGPQQVSGITFQSSGDATIAPSNPLDTNTAVSIGCGGLTMPVYAYGSVPQGNLTITSVATPTASGTWQVGNGDSWLNLAGKFYTTQSNTVALTGAGMTYITSTNNASAFGGNGNNLGLVVKNAAVSFANDGYYSPGVGTLAIPGGSYTLLPNMTLDGGRLSYVYAGQTLAQNSMSLSIGASGGVLDFTQAVEWLCASGVNLKLNGGAVGAPVSLTKAGAGDLTWGAAINGSLYANVKAYGGSIAL
ncbi:MAG: hypothetical protein ACR2IT_08885 [Pirellulales bacterium]